jgi:hypothetical protein
VRPEIRAYAENATIMARITATRAFINFFIAAVVE